MLTNKPTLKEITEPIAAMAKALDEICKAADRAAESDELTIEGARLTLRTIRTLAERAPGA